MIPYNSTEHFLITTIVVFKPNSLNMLFFQPLKMYNFFDLCFKSSINANGFLFDTTVLFK